MPGQQSEQAELQYWLGYFRQLKEDQQFANWVKYFRQRQPGHDVSDEPRDEHGQWTSGGGSGGSDKPAQMELFPELPPLPPAKGKNKLDDFAKDRVQLDAETRTEEKKAAKFLERWNDSVREAPAEFKQEFLGGLNTSMKINYDDHADSMEITGNILDDDGATIGSYTRTIDFKANKASSDYFSLNKQGKGIGKTMLAANVRMYQKLGLDEVEVHANIDVGGYAWAKYGYVPTDSGARSLAEHIRDQLSGGGYTPDEWAQLSDHQQEQVESAWMRATESDFYDSEVESWRDSGGDLAQAKTQLADKFDGNADKGGKWLYDRAVKFAVTVGEGDNVKAQSLGPFMLERGSSVELLVHETTIDYEDRRGDGEEDPDVTVEWDKVDEKHAINDQQRGEIESLIEETFNKEAENHRGDLDPPDWLHDNIRDSQHDYWSSMRDRDKFRWASDNGELPEVGGGSGEIDDEDLRNLVDELESDPKAIWPIADSEHGKDVLLGSDWSGYLDLHDKETMDRFNAYVGKK
jgi:hypothetical protein